MLLLLPKPVTASLMCRVAQQICCSKLRACLLQMVERASKLRHTSSMSTPLTKAQSASLFVQTGAPAYALAVDSQHVRQGLTKQTLVDLHIWQAA